MTAPDPADVELIADVLNAHMGIVHNGRWWSCRTCAGRRGEGLPDADAVGRDEQEHEARAVLAALGGRLLPNGGQARTEWLVTYRSRFGDQAAWSRVSDSREEAEEYLAQGRLEHAENGRWPNLLLESHTVTTYPDGTVVTTPWKEISDAATTAV